MTVNQIISDIRNIATSGSNPIEFRIEDSQLLFWCNEIRSKLISQAIGKKQDVNDVWVQRIKCLELEQVDKSECCDIVTNCYILKSVQEIPDVVEAIGTMSVETILGKIISYTNMFEAKYSKFNKYTKERPRWFVRDRFLYIINEDILKYVNIDLILENPAELADFTDCSGAVCFTMNDTYPCTLKMASDIVDIVYKTKVIPFFQLPTDSKNDASNDGNNQQIKN